MRILTKEERRFVTDHPDIYSSCLFCRNGTKLNPKGDKIIGCDHTTWGQNDLIVNPRSCSCDFVRLLIVNEHWENKRKGFTSRVYRCRFCGDIEHNYDFTNDEWRCENCQEIFA